MQITSQSSRSRIIFYLIVLCVISLGLKLYTVDFSIPPQYDDIGYVLNAIQYSEGDFFLEKKHPGWAIFLAPFMSMLDSNDFLDYINFARILSIVISTITIFPMYILARKFFSEKYSVVAASLFTFEPHLNYNSGAAFSEPLLILALITSMIFILQDKTKYLCLGFIFAGICWWIRLEVIYPIIAIILIYFVVHRAKSNALRNFSFCMILLLIVIAPLFVQRSVQYDDPFYVWYSGTIFADDLTELVAGQKDSGVIGFVETHGILGLLDRLASGFVNIFDTLSRISFPYLFILIPFGILFSLRPIDQKLKRVKANWIMILISIGILIIPFSVIDDRRFLFPLLPFLIILSTIPIQRVTHYGLSTFSFNEKQKSTFLVIIVATVFFLSCTFTTGVMGFGYGSPNLALEHEKLKYTEYLVENFDGRMLRDEVVNNYLLYVSLTSGDNDFRDFKTPRGTNPYPDLYEPGKVVRMSVDGKTVEELITNGETRELKYIAILEEGSHFFPFLNDVYYNEKNYPFMKKVFDSKEMNYKEFQVKVFEIDYNKFHDLIG